jgi:hypothetical protein
MILQLHSYWAYLAVTLLLLSVILFKIGWFFNKKFTVKEQRLALFTLIVFHIQLMLGLAWYFMSPAYQSLKALGMGAVMKNSETRQLAIEHPLMMLMSITLVTIGFSKHKNKTTDKSKYLTLIWFYGIALLIVLAGIPWHYWFE